MEKLFINKDNLEKKDIDEEVIRVKAILKNKNNEILLEHNNNTYQLPGGHRENDEYLETTLKREIKEETGIDIKIDNGPFMVIEQYHKNYFNSNKNRCNKIYYYSLICDKKPNYDEIALTDFEKQTDFNIIYVNKDELENFIEEKTKTNQINDMIAYEMNEVLKVYNKYD